MASDRTNTRGRPLPAKPVVPDVEIVEPTEEDALAMFYAFYERPPDLQHIELAPPNPEWWPEMRDALLRSARVDRKRVKGRGE